MSTFLPPTPEPSTLMPPRLGTSSPSTPQVPMIFAATWVLTDIAWLASGTSTNGGHQVPSDGFFKEFDDLGNTTVAGSQGAMDRKAFIELARRLLYDLHHHGDDCRRDYGAGYATAARVPEGLRFDAPSFVRENPGSHTHIATIIQMFIEHVGVPTVASWTCRARARWSLSQCGSVPMPSAALLPLIQGLLLHTAHYVFHGRVAGWTSLNVPPAPTPFLPSQDVYDIDEIPMDGVTLDLVTAHEHIANLEHNLADSDHQVDILQMCVGDYERIQVDAARELMAVEAELAHLREENLQLRADRAHADTVRLICRVFSPLKWAIEIDSLECFPDHLKGELVLALEQDVSI
ncbi:hypothetical protein B0H14DRAFT_2652100 [Mycena olivaceomarginata]|nr:hypothetical protein B0H14DRAFT_2652100 [Mycena olivaceomarginata]